MVLRDWSDGLMVLANGAGGLTTGTCGQVPFVLSYVNGIKIRTQNMYFAN